jgi:ribonuclease HI
MNEIFLFTDGSVDVQNKIGYGAYLFFFENEVFDDDLSSKVRVKRFENTSSTKLELQTLLWALGEIPEKKYKINVFSDSQNLIELTNRRARFEKNNFCNKRNEPLKNADLYRHFFNRLEFYNCEFQKIKGHQPGRNKNQLERIFTLVDRASRNALRTAK